MNLIVAVDENWAIGKGGDQLAYIKADLKRFRELTSGHAVILGRKTLATFPGGRPLKNRRNLILSATPGYAVEGAEVYADVDELLANAPEDAFVIGGESVYRALLDRCDTAYVTHILHAFPADRWFPDLNAAEGWQETERSQVFEEDGLRFCYVTYKKQ